MENVNLNIPKMQDQAYKSNWIESDWFKIWLILAKYDPQNIPCSKKHPEKLILRVLN